VELRRVRSVRRGLAARRLVGLGVVVNEDLQPPQDPLADLDDEQRAAVEKAMATEQIFSSPVYLPVRFGISGVNIPDHGPGLVLETETPAGFQRLVLTREMALKIATQLKKQAQTGPQLIVPGIAVPQ
jgi:hypothetical protein